MADCPFSSADENIVDLVYRVGSQQQIVGNPADIPCMDCVNDEYNIIYTPLGTVTPISLARYSYYTVPGLFSLLDSSSMGASGILTISAAPVLGNMGRGTLIDTINTGIDYTNPLFHRPDGSTRITGLWGQNIPAGADIIPPGVSAYYELSDASCGTEFTRGQINAVLASESPLDLVPSTDTNGRDTFLAGIATDGFLPRQDFTGAALECELIAVKLKQAGRCLREFYLVSGGADTYQENDTMMRIKYLRVTTFRPGRPLIILIASDSNLGSHEGTSSLNSVVQDANRFLDHATVIAAGSETSRTHHCFGTIPAGQEWDDMEIRVRPEESGHGFTLELWASTTDTYSMGFISPSGEIISRTPVIVRNETSIPFLPEPTAITVNYQLIESGAGEQLILIRFENPVTGIWRVWVHNIQYFTGEFSIWLPSERLVSDETVLLRPTPDTIITMPGSAGAPITVGAYSHLNNSIHIHSNRRFTPSGIVEPELAAPGANVMGPAMRRRINGSILMTTHSGIPVAATHVASAVANLFG